MKCSKCQYENPEGTKFCGECGAKLEKPCSGCGHLNPSQFKFCGECGQPLTTPAPSQSRDLTFDEKLAKIQRYLPEGLTQKILSQRDRIEGERKHITVMFCDMVGFTSLSERLGPEGIYSLMDEVYEILIHKVNDFGGTVNELTGDGIMALFGAPIALEDAPQRAIRSGLAIHSEITRFSERMTHEKRITSLRMRVGIHSGPVVVGTVGNDLRVDFKAIGDTVNLASRMESLAEPGTIWVTEDTFKLTEGLFRFEALGEKEVKGKREPVRVYRVLGTGTSRSRFEARALKGLTRFVGRERELEILWDCYERAKGGRGQAVSIVAQAGLGKSRLLHEFRKSLVNEGTTFLEGHCVSYGHNSPYLPIIDLLKDNFQIRVEDGPMEMREKVKNGLHRVDSGLNETLPYFLELFALENGFDSLKTMAPDIKRRKTFEALISLSLRGAQRRPLVMVFEDLHWIDKTSEESLRLLVDRIPGARLLLVLTFRSNYLPPWGGKSYYSQVNLNRLSNREAVDMVRDLMEAEEIHENLVSLVLDKAEGIPFFVEEFTRSLLESGAVIRGQDSVRLSLDLAPVSIPTTLNNLLMARVDRLPEDAKEILQIGSVIEREFNWDMIKEVTAIQEMELLSRLSFLKEAELIFERGIFPNVIYVFQHALTREVLYDSLLTEKRRQYHQAVGQAMERLYPDRLEDQSPMLAVHFTRGGDPERGYHYHHMAGLRAARSYANREAMEHFSEALRLVDERDGLQDSGKKRLETAIRLAEVMEPLGKFEPTLALLDPILNDDVALGDPTDNAKIHYWMGNTLGNLGRYEDARKYLHRCLEICQVSGSRETEGSACNYLSQLDYMQGYFRSALEHADASIMCMRTVANPARMAWALVTRLLPLCDLKRPDQYEEYLREADDWVERSANDRAKCFLLLRKSMNCLYVGQYEAAQAFALEGLELAERINEGILVVALLSYAGLAAQRSGKDEYGLELLRRSESEGRKLGHPLALTLTQIYLAEVLLHLGRVEEATEPAKEALSFCQALDLGNILKGALEVNAEILAHIAPLDGMRIKQMMAEANSLAERSESNWYRITYWIAWARINLTLGRPEQAIESLSEARTLYVALGLEDGTGEFRCLVDAANRASALGEMT